MDFVFLAEASVPVVGLLLLVLLLQLALFIRALIDRQPIMEQVSPVALEGAPEEGSENTSRGK